MHLMKQNNIQACRSHSIVTIKDVGTVTLSLADGSKGAAAIANTSNTTNGIGMSPNFNNNNNSNTGRASRSSQLLLADTSSVPLPSISPVIST